MRKIKLELKFGTGGFTGFSSIKTSTSNDLNSIKAVRELIQNSMDAAKEAKRKVAKITFLLRTERTEKIPEINKYKEVFEKVKAVPEHRGSDQAEEVIKTIEKCLKTGSLNVLSVIDNGVGLNNKTLHALLGDGTPAKEHQYTSGSYGVGHMVAIPTSDLRYLLYAGVSKDGNRICSGQAVLASFDKTSNGDGYLIKEFDKSENSEIWRRYVFAEKDEVPRWIGKYLDMIEGEWKHGTAIIIPGFNNFRDEGKESLWDIIAKAAACNFFAAIEHGGLELKCKVVHKGKSLEKTLDKAELNKVLEKNKENKSKKGFLSGREAYQLWNTINQGRVHTISLEGLGEVKIYLLPTTEDGRCRIGICRNGMWITNGDNISSLHHDKFSDREPFHALILFDGFESEISRLIRKAEGPLHNSIQPKMLSDECDRRSLRSAFNQIQEWLREHTAEISNESYIPNDGFSVEGEGEFNQVNKRANLSLRGSARILDRVPQVKRRGKSTDVPNPNKKKARNPQDFRALFSIAKKRSDGDMEQKGRICVSKTCKNSEFSMQIDENTDATCDSLNLWWNSSVKIKKLKLDGVAITDDYFINGGEAVKLGNLMQNKEYEIEVIYSVPESVTSLKNQELMVSPIVTPRKAD